jgi:hypothetical protein
MARVRVRLRFRHSSPTAERWRVAAWVAHVLERMDGGAHAPVTAIAFPDGFRITLYAEVAEARLAVPAATAALGEVVGDTERVLGRLVHVAVDPPRWDLVPAFPRIGLR